MGSGSAKTLEGSPIFPPRDVSQPSIHLPHFSTRIEGRAGVNRASGKVYDCEVGDPRRLRDAILTVHRQNRNKMSTANASEKKKKTPPPL